jgi:hypothetical protein
MLYSIKTLNSSRSPQITAPRPFFTGTIAKHVSTRVSFLQILELCTLHTGSRHFHADIHCPNGPSFLENVQNQDMVLYSIYPRRLLYVDLPYNFTPLYPEERTYTDL